MTHTVSATISDETLSRIITIESGGNPKAKAKTSSATGLGQFLNGTWLEELQEHRPDLFNGAPFDDELALRTNATIMIELLARFTEDNARDLGAGYTDGDLYLAHFSGVGTAKKLLRAKASAPASSCYKPAAIKANKSILEGKTVGEVRAWAARKMAAAGKVNWVARLYRPQVPLPPVKPLVPVDDVPAAPVQTPAAPTVPMTGDPETFSIQSRLKAMNYNPGLLDGKWGGSTAGAITAIINDRQSAISPPASLEEFTAAIDKLKVELASAEAEGWKKPVTAERAKANPAIVAEVAPEVVPIKQNYFYAKWVALMTFLGGLWDAFSSYVSEAWDFFFEHKDDIPTDPGMLKTLWGYVGMVPTSVWVIAAAAGLAFIAFNSGRAVNSINASVQTGARQ